MEHSMTSTTFELDGSRVIRQLGVVRGIVVRSRSVFGTIGGMLHTIIGGNITLFTELCEKTRDEAFTMMISQAEKIGANGVINVRFMTSSIMGGAAEILAYGTAVKLK